MISQRINNYVPKEGNVRHNFLVIGGEFVAFGLAIALMNPNTLLPAFAKELGASTIMVGMVTAVLQLTWNLPQLIAGPVVSMFESKKKILMRAILIGRPFILLFGVAIWLTGGQPSWLIMGLLFLAIIAMFGTDAFAGVAWFDILGRAFRHDKRPGYMSLWHASSSLAVLAVSGVIALILSENGPGFPNNYALLFVLAGVSLQISTVFLAMIREPAPAVMAPGEEKPRIQSMFPQLLSTWRSDAELRRVTMSRFFFAFSSISFPFYVLYATEELALPVSIIGVFVGAQTAGSLIGSLVLGRVGNRFGAHISIRIGLIAMLTAPIFALLIDWTGLSILVAGFMWVYICIGFADSTMLIGYLNTTIALAPDSKRAVYMGLTNSISGLAVISPVIGGWMVSQLGYSSVFIASLVCIGIALVLVITFNAPPLEPEQTVEIISPANAKIRHAEGV